MNNRPSRPASLLTGFTLLALLGCSADPEDPSGSGGASGSGTPTAGLGQAGSTFAGGGTGSGMAGSTVAGSPAAGSTFAGAPAGGTTSTAGAAPVAGTSTGTAGAASTGMCQPLKVTAGKVDDFEDGNNAILMPEPFKGYWYIYNDGTGAQIPAKDVGGSNPFMGMAPGSTASPMFAGCTKGSGFTMWGAGMGVNLQDLGGGKAPCTVNATGLTGIKFNVKGTGSIRLQISSAPTASPTSGGTCAAAMGCDYHANGPITLTPAWTPVMIPFATMALGVAALDPATIIAIQFQAFAPVAMMPIPDFDFCVDDIEFY